MSDMGALNSFSTGDVETGGDFVGRDKHIGGDSVGHDKAGRDVVNNYGGPALASDSELLRDIHDLLLGNPLKGRGTGLVHSVSEMRQEIENLSHLFWALAVGFVVLALAVAYLLISASQSPAAVMQVPHQAAVYAKSQVGDYGILPGNEQGQHAANDGYTDGGKSWAVSMPDVAVLLRPFQVDRPNVAVEGDAGQQAKRRNIPEPVNVEDEIHRWASFASCECG